MSVDMSKRGLRAVSELGSHKPHGTRLRYLSGCKCLLCKAANSQYEVMRSKARRSGEGNGLVPSTDARQHILALSRAGIGRRTIVDISGVGGSIIQAIKNGEKQNIRKQTETKILSVTKEAISDGTLIDAKPTWAIIKKLLREGFTEATLAKRLGYKTPKIQINRKKITGRTAAKIQRFYNRIMEGA